MRSNIVLIGMPGAGKSTVGPLLAQRLQKTFIDTDALIESAAGASLQNIVDQRGQQAIRDLEEAILCSLDCLHCIIATGGSAVYSTAGMAHMKSIGTLIYLQLDFPTVEQRVSDFSQRGLVRRAEQSLADLYRERVPLYARYADLTIDCDAQTPDAVCESILRLLHQ